MLVNQQGHKLITRRPRTKQMTDKNGPNQNDLLPLYQSCCKLSATLAAMKGHLECLQNALQDRDKSSSQNLWIYPYAAQNGHLHILEWLLEEGYPWDERTCQCAAFNGHLEVLKWLQEKGCPWDHHTCEHAAYKGHLEVLKWAHENGCPWNEETCLDAVLNGHFEVLKWAHEHGCPWDKRTCIGAAITGDLDTLKWAREHGCSWSENVVGYAMLHGHTDIVLWAIDNGCPYDKDDPNISRVITVHEMVRSIFFKVVQDAACRVIQRYFLDAYYDPTRSLCWRRSMRQYAETISL